MNELMYKRTSVVSELFQLVTIMGKTVRLCSTYVSTMSSNHVSVMVYVPFLIFELVNYQNKIKTQSRIFFYHCDKQGFCYRVLDNFSRYYLLSNNLNSFELLLVPWFLKNSSFFGISGTQPGGNNYTLDGKDHRFEFDQDLFCFKTETFCF